MYTILTVVIIVVVVVAAFAVFGGVFKEKPILQVSQTLSGKTNDSVTLNFSVTNVGGDANGVVITASSTAFTQGTTTKIDIPAGKTVVASCQVTVNDIESKDYPITLTYTADGNIFGAFSGNVAGNAVFHVLPSLEIVDVHWKNDIAWIGQQGNFTLLYFNIKSNTDFAAEGVNVKLALTPTVDDLVVNPSSMEVAKIGPKATSEQISVAVAAYGAQVGNHPLQIELSLNGYVIDTASTAIEVRG